MVDEERESSEEGEKSPEHSKNNPARALRGGNHFNVTEVKSLVAFNQDQLFNQKKVISPKYNFVLKPGITVISRPPLEILI